MVLKLLRNWWRSFKRIIKNCRGYKILAHSTATLAGKLGKKLLPGLDKVRLIPGDQLKGTVFSAGNKGKYSSRLLPAMSCIRTGLSVRRANSPRPSVGRSGVPISVDEAMGIAKLVKFVPVLLPHSVTILTADLDDCNRIEASLVWFLEEDHSLEVPMKLEEIEFTLPISIRPSSAQEQSLTITRQESWEDSKLYRIDFDLECESFVLKSDTKPMIREFVYTALTTEEVTLFSGTITPGGEVWL